MDPGFAQDNPGFAQIHALHVTYTWHQNSSTELMCLTARISLLRSILLHDLYMQISTEPCMNHAHISLDEGDFFLRARSAHY